MIAPARIGMPISWQSFSTQARSRLTGYGVDASGQTIKSGFKLARILVCSINALLLEAIFSGVHLFFKYGWQTPTRILFLSDNNCSGLSKNNGDNISKKKAIQI